MPDIYKVESMYSRQKNWHCKIKYVN